MVFVKASSILLALLIACTNFLIFSYLLLLSVTLCFHLDVFKNTLAESLAPGEATTIALRRQPSTLTVKCFHPRLRLQPHFK